MIAPLNGDRLQCLTIATPDNPCKPTIKEARAERPARTIMVEAEAFPAIADLAGAARKWRDRRGRVLTNRPDALFKELAFDML
ncbi:hypothetical protein AC629_13705 [Bradyrhizobium sp. NAS80.1]|nr:hypothetical protein AC629_13705 [Bradyrhizobium sp. NAS80.1]